MRHKVTGYVQLIVCSVAFIYGEYSVARGNQLLKSMAYAPSERCSDRPSDYKLVDVKGVKRCIIKTDAVAWTQANEGVQIAILIAVIFLFVPAVVRGDLVRSRRDATE